MQSYENIEQVRAGRPSPEETVEEFGDLAPAIELLGNLAEAAAELTFYLRDGKLDDPFLALDREAQTRFGIVTTVGAHTKGVAGYVADLFEREPEALIS